MRRAGKGNQWVLRLGLGLAGTVLLGTTAEALWDLTLFQDGCRNRTAAEAARLVEDTPGLQILDVRSRAEARTGVILGSVHRSFGEPGCRDRLRTELDPDRPVLVYCAGGFRSLVVGWLRSAGFREVHHLHRGMWSWKWAGARGSGPLSRDGPGRHGPLPPAQPDYCYSVLVVAAVTVKSSATWRGDG